LYPLFFSLSRCDTSLDLRYAFLGATEHDAHHEHFDVNFGVSLFMDKLLGTGFEGSALQAKVNRSRLSRKGGTASSTKAAAVGISAHGGRGKKAD
jgi:sterol desaturase/sphingolipid hydroxylase (fatty acid hydroxylase superfamily)